MRAGHSPEFKGMVQALVKMGHKHGVAKKIVEAGHRRAFSLAHQPRINAVAKVALAAAKARQAKGRRVL